MRIEEETADRLVVKNAVSRSWLMMLGLSVAVPFLALIIIAFADAAGTERRGSSRAPAGAVVFIFPVAALVFYFLDRRHNRKALIMSAVSETAFVVGSKTLKIPFAEINGFCLGKSALYNTPLIEIELKNGSRVSSGIDVPRGKDDDLPEILGKLTVRLKGLPPQPLSNTAQNPFDS